MFFSYLWNELRRRRRQSFVVSLGLALGIGMVVAVSAMATGVQQAQSNVLHSLYGVGTDITVTQAPARNAGPGAGFRFGPQDGGAQQKFSRDQIFADPTQETFAASKADQVAKLAGVRDAVGALSLTAIHINGKLPTGPVTSGQGTSTGIGPSPQAQATGAPGQVNVSSYTIEGVDVTDTSVGPLSSTRISSGRGFTSADERAKDAVLSRSYARQRGLAVGDSITIGGTKLSIVGLATSTTSGGGSDVYIPLATARSLAGEVGKINTIYVKATSASSIATAKAAIAAALPTATVTTASDLAKQVTGSLASASNLATKLGRWLSVAALILAIVLASLLTLSSVGRRVRELGTLKALGWRTPRVVGQVMGESLVQGVIGGALGLGIGLAGAWLVTRLSPSLNATVSALGGNGGGGGPNLAVAGPGGGTNPFSHTVSVALHAPINTSLVAIAIGLALVGGAIAGLAGGWRAARMRPADAMRQVV